MKLSKREAALLVILILVGGGYLINYFMFRPLYAQRNHLTAEKASLTRELEQLQQKMSQYADIEQNEKIVAEYGKMQAKIPSVPMIPTIIESLELSAQEENIKIQSIKYKEDANVNKLPGSQKTDSDPPLQTVDFQIIARGSYFNLLSFILKIESAPRIYVINSSKISLGKADKVPAAATENLTVQEEDPTAEYSFETAASESGSFDQSQTVLYLDFSAYYDNSLL
ncbi:MAG: hypothetical protein WC147_01430 [Syntrophomonas sp.]